jgi:cytoskeleton protein RodZ
MVVAAAVILVLVVVLWRRDSRNAHMQAAASTPSAASGPASAAPEIRSSQPLSTQPSTQNPQPSGGQPATNNPASPAAQTTADDTGDPNRAIPLKNRAATKNAAPQLTLVIRASENSWISVSADGQAASHENLIAPAHTSVRASHDVVVKVGNAAGVSYLFNGKEIPPQGSESEVQTLVFDSSGLKTTQSAPAAPTTN